MTTLKFEHIHYRTTDFQATRDFYVNIMEAEDLGIVDLAGTPSLRLQLADVLLLFAAAGDDPPAPIPANKRLGVYHICFLVEDCDAATEYYRSRGAEVAVQPFMATDEFKVSFLNAPDGMWVELKQIIS